MPPAITDSFDAKKEKQVCKHQPKLLDRLRTSLRSRHYSRRTEQTYSYWIKRFVYFHKMQHPAEMAETEINTFLTHLAVKEHVSSSTQNQALYTILFLYRHVLNKEIGEIKGVIRACKPKRLPVVLTKDVKTTMIYTHVFNRGGKGVISPADNI